jgi:hypothetical protein
MFTRNSGTQQKSFLIGLAYRKCETQSTSAVIGSFKTLAGGNTSETTGKVKELRHIQGLWPLLVANPS